MKDRHSIFIPKLHESRKVERPFSIGWMLSARAQWENLRNISNELGHYHFLYSLGYVTRKFDYWLTAWRKSNLLVITKDPHPNDPLPKVHLARCPTCWILLIILANLNFQGINEDAPKNKNVEIEEGLWLSINVKDWATRTSILLCHLSLKLTSERTIKQYISLIFTAYWENWAIRNGNKNTRYDFVHQLMETVYFLERKKKVLDLTSLRCPLCGPYGSQWDVIRYGLAIVEVELLSNVMGYGGL